MKIAISSLITRKISKLTFGGTEMLTYDLIEGLKKKGHEITLYAASDSEIDVPIVPVVDTITAQKTALDEKLSFPYYLLLTQRLALDSSKYDIIHNNFFNTYLLQAFAPFINVPIIHTVHNAFFYDKDWSTVLRKIGFRPNDHIVFVSKKSQEFAGNLPNSHVIYNGVDTSLYTYNENATGNLLWLGRMAAEKGAHNAVLASQKSQKPLIINTAIYKTSHQQYFDTHVKPVLHPLVTIQENKNLQDKITEYQQAKAYLFPIEWEEPFGLVLAEAMACGTPIVAYARGSTPEIIQDGVTGFLVNSSPNDIRGEWIIKKTGIDGLTEAIERIYAMSPQEYAGMRKKCREHAEKNFSIERMVRDYEQLYLSVLVKNKLNQ